MIYKKENADNITLNVDEEIIEYTRDNKVYKNMDKNNMENTYVYSNLFIGELNEENTNGDMLKYYMDNEKKYIVNFEYMEGQNNIDAKMRKILVDWLVEVVVEFGLKIKTLYLCVNIMDRFLSKKSVARNKLQLVGITALMIAVKYEENKHLNIRDYSFISNYTYTISEILDMEFIILNTIDFNLTITTIPMLLTYYHTCLNLNSNIKFLSQYICELSIQELKYLKYTPSTIAKSSIILSDIINKIPYTLHEDKTEYPLTKYIFNLENHPDNQDCIKFLYKLLLSQTNSEQRNIYKQYCLKKHNQVALLLEKISDFIKI